MFQIKCVLNCIIASVAVKFPIVPGGTLFSYILIRNAGKIIMVFLDVHILSVYKYAREPFKSRQTVCIFSKLQ